MSRRLTIYEVAREAGLWIASVSRVMHGRDGVSERTREHVEQVVERSDAEHASVVLPTVLVVRESCGCAGAVDG